MTDARALVHGLGATAVVLGALAFVVGTPVRSARRTRDTLVSAATRDALAAATVQPRAEAISALQLAQWIRDGKPGLRVLDLRDSSAFEARHVPSAEWLEPTRLSAVVPKPSETVVLYSDDGARGVAWLAAAGHAHVYVVRGGMSAWMTQVIDPVVAGDSAAMVATLSRYFGGVPRSAAARADTSAARTTRTTPKARVRNATDEFGFVARRGC